MVWGIRDCRRDQFQVELRTDRRRRRLRFRGSSFFCVGRREEFREDLGVTLALLPGDLDRLLQLPGTESRPKCSSNRLVFFRAVVVAQAIIGQAETIGKHPAGTIVLRQKTLQANA